MKTPRLSKKIKRRQIVNNINTIAMGIKEMTEESIRKEMYDKRYLRGQVDMYNKIMKNIQVMSPEFNHNRLHDI